MGGAAGENSAHGESARPDIALVSASFGGIDELKPLPPHPGVDAFFYTDDAQGPAETAATWTRVVVPDYPRHDFNPRLRAKYFKLQIHRLDEVAGHRWLAWADGAFLFRELAFLAERAAALAELPPHRRALLIPHQERATVAEEFEFVQREMAAGNDYLVQRYAQERMSEQMADFRRRGWNTGARLWCGGFWLMENSDRMRRALDGWWDQNLRYGIMDQLSLPVVLDAHGIEPQAWPVAILHNPHFSYVPHRRAM